MGQRPGSLPDPFRLTFSEAVLKSYLRRRCSIFYLSEMQVAALLPMAGGSAADHPIKCDFLPPFTASPGSLTQALDKRLGEVASRWEFGDLILRGLEHQE